MDYDFFPESEQEVQSREHAAEMARLAERRRRAEEEARRAIEEERRKREEAARAAEEARRKEEERRAADEAERLAAQNARYDFNLLKQRVGNDIDGCVQRAEIHAVLPAYHYVIELYETVVVRETQAARLEFHRQIRDIVDQMFLMASIEALKEVEDADQKVAYQRLFGTAMFQGVMNRIKASPVDVYGEQKPMDSQVVVNFEELAKLVIGGGHSALAAPTQCGKTGCEGAVAVLGRLSKTPTIMVMGASLVSMEQMAKQKMPDFVRHFGVEVKILNHSFMNKMAKDPLLKEKVRNAKVLLVALWTRLDCVKQLMDIFGDETKINLIVDETDEIVSHALAPRDAEEAEKHTTREKKLAEIHEMVGKLHAVIDVTSTPLGNLAWMEARGYRYTAYIECEPGALALKKYRGLDRLVPLRDDEGNPMFIPERSESFKGGKATAYGLYSAEVKALYAAFNQPSPPVPAQLGDDDLPCTARMMFHSMGHFVKADKGGFELQAKHILDTLSPGAIVLMLVAEGASRLTLDASGNVVKDPCTMDEDGSKASIIDAIREYHNIDQARIVILTQKCGGRSVSFCTRMCSINFSTFLAGAGTNIGDLMQLFGRVTGFGPAFKGDVVGLFTKTDYDALQCLADGEFTRLAFQEHIAGRDFKNCDALKDPRFSALLEVMKRPFHRKKTLNKMPENTAGLKRKREEAEAAAAAAAAAASSSRRAVAEDDPLYIPPNRHTIPAWKCVMLSLRDTPCYDGDTLTTAQVRMAATDLMAINGHAWEAQHDLMRSLKVKGYIEDLPALVKLTPAGKRVCDSLV
jgi:hypothetical protein